MVKRQTALKIRKTHRYLGIFIGIQFLMWTISGLYFSWTDIDEIHGDQFRKEMVTFEKFQELKSPSDVYSAAGITSVELKDIAGIPHYWLNDSKLVNAKTGEARSEISQEEAQMIAKQYMREDLKVTGVERIDEAGDHHEYRGSPLPAYVISYDSSENIRAYVAANNGAFRSVRYRDWRWFDFLWMTHTMDYEGRDDFNNLLLRAFSIMGLLTVLSGFTLWYTSSPTIRKIFNKNKNKKEKKK
tara:strand:+ start:2601 stop:3329 length:729 start_codon:yes stop_codon:yes gene_type:complete